MKGGSELGLHKHVKTKHHAVSATKRGSEDDSQSLIPMGEVSAHDDADSEDSVPEDVVADIGGCEDDCDNHKPEMQQRQIGG